MTWMMPVKKVKLGTLFGVKDAAHPNGHRGVDFNGFPKGEPLYAVTDGKIVINQWSDVLGWVAVLEVMVNGQARSFGYCHLAEKSPHNVGHPMKVGEVVGVAGTTGSASSGVHLHLTLSPDRKGVFAGPVEDAYAFIKKMMASAPLGQNPEGH